MTRKEGGGGNPFNGLYGEAPPERGTFFRFQVYKRVGISQVYEKVGKSVISYFVQTHLTAVAFHLLATGISQHMKMTRRNETVRDWTSERSLSV